MTTAAGPAPFRLPAIVGVLLPILGFSAWITGAPIRFVAPLFDVEEANAFLAPVLCLSCVLLALLATALLQGMKCALAGHAVGLARPATAVPERGIMADSLP